METWCSAVLETREKRASTVSPLNWGESDLTEEIANLNKDMNSKEGKGTYVLNLKKKGGTHISMQNQLDWWDKVNRCTVHIISTTTLFSSTNVLYQFLMLVVVVAATMMTTVRGTMVRGMMVMVNNNNSDDDDDDFVELLQIFVGQHRSFMAEWATYTKQGIRRPKYRISRWISRWISATIYGFELNSKKEEHSFRCSRSS